MRPGSDPLETLFDRRYHPMLRLASWLVGDQALAEDLVQDAFVRLARLDLGSVDSVDAYLRTTVVNLVRSHHRRVATAQRHKATIARDGGAGISPDPSTFLVDQELVAALRRLPRRQQEVIALRFVEDLKVDDIAGALDLSPGSVKSHLHRGLRTLERLLDPDPDPDRRSTEARP